MFEPFTYKSLEAIRKKILDLDLSLPLSNNIEVLKQPLEFRKMSIPNRLSIQPMEGFDAKVDGAPSELTLRRYKRYAKGGAGLIWFEATSIVEEGRSNPHQLMLTEKNYKEFRNLLSLVRNLSKKTLNNLGFPNNCIFILQLNHSGRYSKYNNKKYPIRAYHNQELDHALGTTEKEGKVINDEELEDLEHIWIRKALIAKEAGFDGVDIKACHGYLISELLNSYKRLDSKYGGSPLEKRSLFLKNIVKGLRKKNNEFIITTRLGVFDGIPYPYGFGVKKKQNSIVPLTVDLKEPIELINTLNDIGVEIFNITAGNPHYNSFVTRPYDTPIKGESIPPEHPLISVDRILSLCGAIKSQISNEIITISSGFSYLRQYAGFVASGLIEKKKTDICGFGRMALANPEFPKQLFQKGIINKNKSCITCSKCSEFMRYGKETGCAIRDPLYRKKD